MHNSRTAAYRTEHGRMATRRTYARRASRAKMAGISLLLASLLLVVYAVPCFAASIWDEGLAPQGAGTTFSEPINDNAYVQEVEEATAEAEVASASAVRAASKVNASVTETTGPGIALDDDAVSAAKKRVQAVSAAKVERDAVIGAISAEQPVQRDRTIDILTGAFALVLASLFAILGTRSIVVARQSRAFVASATYGHALKA